MSEITTIEDEARRLIRWSESAERVTEGGIEPAEREAVGYAREVLRLSLEIKGLRAALVAWQKHVLSEGHALRVIEIIAPLNAILNPPK